MQEANELSERETLPRGTVSGSYCDTVDNNDGAVRQHLSERSLFEEDFIPVQEEELSCLPHHSGIGGEDEAVTVEIHNAGNLPEVGGSGNPVGTVERRKHDRRKYVNAMPARTKDVPAAGADTDADDEHGDSSTETESRYRGSIKSGEQVKKMDDDAKAPRSASPEKQ